MITLREGNLTITFPNSVRAWKFDDEAKHGLSHCMKAVDFIAEMEDRYLFIEVKDPQHPHARREKREEWAQQFLAGRMDEDLKYKYRDSFLYTWAERRPKKPIYYLILIALETLTEAELVTRTDNLKRKLPLEGPRSGAWRRAIVEGCAVFTIASWNKLLPFPVSRG